MGLLALTIAVGVFAGDDEPTMAAPGAASAEATNADAEADRRAEAEKKAKAAMAKKAKAPAAKKKVNQGQAATVTNVVDGDTVDLSSGERVRVIGIDTPERGECGFTVATQHMERLALGRKVTLVAGARDDRDRYDRILRYVDVGSTDAGLSQINKGYANARYDSRDGYGAHARESRYIKADAATKDNFACTNSGPGPSEPAPAQATAPSGGSVNYKNCAAAKAAGAAPVHAGQAGYGTHLDRDRDGVGCEG